MKNEELILKYFRTYEVMKKNFNLFGSIPNREEIKNSLQVDLNIIKNKEKLLEKNSLEEDIKFEINKLSKMNDEEFINLKNLIKNQNER